MWGTAWAESFRSVRAAGLAALVLSGFGSYTLSAATAETPATAWRFSCEGFLQKPDGTPLTGTVLLGLLVFRGGSAQEADSGTLVYAETVETEAINGRVAHAVGTGTPTFGSLSSKMLMDAGAAGNSDQELWLQIEVGEDQQALLPRTPLRAVPYAATAGDAQRLGGTPAEAFVTAAQLAKALAAGAGQDAAKVLKAAGTGYLSFIGGGQNQDSSGGMSGIVAGTDNHATWWAAFVGGGSFNWATGAYSAVAGGLANAALHNQSFVGGGSENTASGFASVVGGGVQNTASGLASTVAGGQSNTASGEFSFAAGRRAKATASGAFALADSQNADFINSTPDSFRVRAQRGVAVITSHTLAGIDISNSGGIGLAVNAPNGHGVAVATIFGDGIVANSITGDGVNAISQGGDLSTALRGTHVAHNGTGIIAQAHTGPVAYAVWGRSIDGFAGVFAGKVNVEQNLNVGGTLTKSAGAFKIDHPLDPANKYLSHSFVESPDMKNVYDGTVKLNESGEATVELPPYFEALNQDFRYQLTPIGAPALLYIADTIENNRFRIAGGEPGMVVSWMVTGIRKDAYAAAHPIVVEEEKAPSDKGHYLHPQLHGKKSERSILDSVRMKELGTKAAK